MTDWEEHYRAEHTPWDKGAPAPPLMDLLAANPAWEKARIVVPGCGAGHDVRALAARFPEADVIGLDLAPSALERAKTFPSAGSEGYELADWFALEELPGGGKADVIWEHTCFCAIDQDRRDDYVDAAHTILRPGGELLGVFYLDPYDEEHQPGGGPPHGTTVEELEERFSRRFEILEQWMPERTYPGREGLEWMMRMVRA